MAIFETINMVGNKYNRLTAKYLVDYDKHRNARWMFECECGKTVILPGSTVRSGHTKSCGCYRIDNPNTRTHGATGTATHKIWLGMLDRCLSKSNKHYANYGGRGIGISEPWMRFENFLQDMGERPDSLSIERINNELGYSKENCRWANRIDQQNNTRRNVFIDYDGRRQTIAQWAREKGINYQTLYVRIFTRHWSIERALS